MKKLLTSFVAVCLSVCLFAQSTAKNSPYPTADKDVVQDGNTTYYFNGGFKYQAGFSIPFFHDSDISSGIAARYGARAEVGYMTSGMYSFYAALAYQFYGITDKSSTSHAYGWHRLDIPALFSIRIPSKVPMNFRVGPYLDFLMGGYVDGTCYTKDLSFGKRFGWGFQFIYSISYFQIGYVLDWNNGEQGFAAKGFTTSALTLGVVF